MDLDTAFPTAFSEYADARTVYGMDILVGTATLSGQMPTADAQQALLRPRREVDMMGALGHLLPQPTGPTLPPPAAPDDFASSVVLSEPAYDEWSLEAYIKHADNNFETINAFIANTNNKFKTLYTMTLADMKRAVNENEDKITDVAKSLQQQIDTMGVQLDLVQYGSGARGSRDAAPTSRKDPDSDRPEPAGRPLPEPQRIEGLKKDVAHVFDMVHLLKDSNNSLVKDYASFKDQTTDEIKNYEKQILHLSTQLVESKLHCDQQLGLAALDTNSIQHVFEDKIGRLETLVNNLPLSPPPNLHHTTRGGPAPAYPGQMVTPWQHSPHDLPGRHAETKPSDWLSGLAHDAHRPGRPSPSVCGSDCSKTYNHKSDMTPLVTPTQPFDENKWSLGKKPPPNLTPFNGKRESFSAFHDRVRDHCGCANSAWKPLLDSIKARRDHIYSFNLIAEDSWRGLDGQHLTKLSNELWNFLGFCVTDDVHRNRSATTRGEIDNGFELWRKYCYDNTIGAASTETRTCDDFHSFGQCNHMQYLEKHILEWDNLRLQVAADLPDHHLRSKFCGILPQELQQKIKDRDDLPRFDDVWTYVERRLALLHDEEISAFKAKERQERIQQRPHSHYSVSMVTDGARDSPAANPLQQEIQELKNQIAALVNNRGRGRDQSRQPPARRTRTPPIMDPEWKRGACFECGTTDHIISNCPVRVELRKKYGKIPEGHKTLYQKRQEMLRKQQQEQKNSGASTSAGSIKAISEVMPMPAAAPAESAASPASADNADLDAFKDAKPFGWAVLRREPVHAVQGGKFNALTNHDDEDSDCDIDSTINSLKQELDTNPLPKKTKMPKLTRPSQQQRRDAKELEKIGVSNPRRVAAVLDQIRKGELQVPLPDDGTTLGKVLSLVDSGSSINAASKKKHFKGAEIKNANKKSDFFIKW